MAQRKKHPIDPYHIKTLVDRGEDIRAYLESLKLDRSQMIEAVTMYEELVSRKERRKIDTFYPASGPLARHKYKKHMKFFELGAEHRERLFMAANRVGKTEGVGGYETTLHLLGAYPDWWKGYTFNRPTNVWIAGDTGKTVRDINQAKVMGKTDIGTGLIPADSIKKTTTKQGTPGAFDQAWVSHVTGGTSLITFKSYDQGRDSFQGEEVDVIWLDEECPEGIYDECLIRMMTTGGRMMLTFTPINGLTSVVMRFLPDGAVPPDGFLILE